MTWLNEHIHKVGNLFEQRFGPQEDGVRSGFAKMIEPSLSSFSEEDGPETGKRFEIDMLPYVAQELLGLSSCLRLSPEMVEELRSLSLGGDNNERIRAYSAEKGFTFIDLPTGCYSIGAAFEVKALFVRSATMLKRGNVVAPAFSDRYHVFDAIFGRPRKPSRQRLSWRIPGDPIVVQARIPKDESYRSETLKPAVMLQKAGLDTQTVLDDLTKIAMAAILFEQAHRGTARARIVPGLPYAESATRERMADTDRSIVTFTRLSQGTESN